MNKVLLIASMLLLPGALGWKPLKLDLRPWLRSSIQTSPGEVVANGMRVRWTFEHDRIWIEMEAPTRGWIAVGFNHTRDLTACYLLMGAVSEGEVKVEPHYTFRPGHYVSFAKLGVPSRVEAIEGGEDEQGTWLRFSLPVRAQARYARDLLPGKDFVLHLAYSQEDDFAHHSRMRTAVRVQW